MIKIRTFSSTDSQNISEDINSFLKGISDDNFIDIKQSDTLVYNSDRTTLEGRILVTVIYKDKRQPKEIDAVETSSVETKTQR